MNYNDNLTSEEIEIKQRQEMADLEEWELEQIEKKNLMEY